MAIVNRLASDAVGKARARAFPGLAEVAVAAERDERGFPAVVVFRADAPQAVDLGADAAAGDGIGVEVVALLQRTRRVGGEGRELVDELVDRSAAIVGRTLPGRLVIAPLDQIARGALQPLHRPVLVILVGSPARRAPERPPEPFSRVRQLLVQPADKRLVEDLIGLRFGEDGKRRVDARFDRPLAQELGAEPVDGADVRILEVVHRVAETSCLPCACRTGRVAVGRQRRAPLFELLANAQLQLAGGFFAEGDRHDLANLGAAGLDQADDARHELGGLAGASGGLDDERLVERLADRPAVLAPSLMASPAARSGRRTARAPCVRCAVPPGGRRPPRNRSTRTRAAPAGPRACRARWRDR